MNRLSGLLKKVLLLITTGSLSFIIAACYGVMMPFDRLRSWHVRTRTPEGAPIRNLQVSLIATARPADTLDIAFTDSAGLARVSVYGDEGDSVSLRAPDYTVAVADVDSQENGGRFRSEYRVMTDADTIDVIMRPDSL